MLCNYLEPLGQMIVLTKSFILQPQNPKSGFRIPKLGSVVFRVTSSNDFLQIIKKKANYPSCAQGTLQLLHGWDSLVVLGKYFSLWKQRFSKEASWQKPFQRPRSQPEDQRHKLGMKMSHT